MKTTVNSYDFHRAFEQTRPENFSYQGLNILFEHFESFEEDSGTELELDVIAICCDFSEDTAKEIAEDYGIDVSDCEHDDEVQETVMQHLEDNTSVCGATSDGTIVYQVY